MKTKKAYAKRIKVTKSGKVMLRTPGINHFNAKASRSNQLNKKRGTALPMTNKEKGHFLSGIS